jgi:hypothetical protein
MQAPRQNFPRDFSPLQENVIVAAAGMQDAIKRWEEFCESIRTSGRDILQAAEQADALSQAEGLRYLTRLLRGGIEKFVEYSDPTDPCLANVYNTHLKWGLDNPDSLYAMGYVDGQREYVITGNVGTVSYFNFTSSKMSTTAKYEITGVLNSTDVKTDANGNYTVYVGGPKRDTNWLPMDPQSNSLLVRQTFLDRSRETELTFDLRFASEAGRAPLMTMEQALARSKQSEAFFANTGRTFINLTATMMKSVNQLPRVDQNFMLSMGADPNYAYFWGSFDLKPGEALLVHFPEVPNAENWNLCLYNYWLESLDFTKARIYLSKPMAQLNADGSLTIVVSDEKPTHGNWLDTLGHQQGCMMSRWIKPDRVVLPLTEVVRLNAVDLAQKMKRWPT